MPECSICGEKIPEGSRTCAICGSGADEFLPMATMLGNAPVLPKPVLRELPPGGRYCIACATVYGPEHTDPFCTCGMELSTESPPAGIVEEIPFAPVLDDVPAALVLDELPALPVIATASESDARRVCLRPSPGTPCLALYSPDKQPLQYFPLSKDATLIGRLDAVKGVFPDIDLDEWFDHATVRKVSRQHALVLRTRASNTFALRPLPGNTGTQLESQMLQPLQDYPLRPGHRIILGGAIRLKFEIA